MTGLRPHSLSALAVLATLVLAALLTACEPAIPADPGVLARLPDTVDYNYHIKPILSDRCYACHGPDEHARKAELRLFTEAGAKEAVLSSGGRAIVPGSLRRSEMFHRIYADDADAVMPPPPSNLTLTAYEKALIARWIEQGAPWQPHWAFTPPSTPATPAAAAPAWPRNPIDHFVLDRLQREGLQPAPEADKERLLRRVTLDLTGLPPTLDALDAFLADDRPDAYERAVDRLLATDAYGEHQAVAWMDLARYADSHGYHADGYRMMWPWRDWVIDAFNGNMPYDQFVTWQLAGDLLPDASQEQILATGFNRNHQMTAEGGAIDEEYRVEYVADRTDTFGKAFLGLTTACARCHDHKFDPISQKEYYQLAAFFNNVDELGMTGDDGNAGPMLMLSSEETAAQRAYLRVQVIRQEAALAQRQAQVKASGVYRRQPAVRAAMPRRLLAHYPLDQVYQNLTRNRLVPDNPATMSGTPELVPGPEGLAMAFDYDYDFLSLERMGRFERTDPYAITLWVSPDRRGAYAALVGNAHHKNTYWRGHEVYLDSLNRVAVRLIHARPHNYLHVATTDSVRVRDWTHVAVTYDGSSKAAGVKIYLNGHPAPVEIHYDNLYKSILPVDGAYKLENRPLRVARSYRAFGGDDGIFRGRLDEIRLYGRMLTAAEVARVHGTDRLAEILRMPFTARTPEEDDLILEHYLHSADTDYRRLLRELSTLREREHALVDTIPEVMVMQERPAPRPTYVLERGQYDARGEQVQPGVPEALGGFPDDLPPNRLGLARWLTAPDNPLLARVTVNRFWQQLFGQGLVATPQDFGSQGALPSHPALMDWLATAFVDTGWDVKALLRLIVTSATYRQASDAGPDLLAHDPDNVLLARGPRHRLPAEVVRDNALAASGLLVRKVGGPSVKPYQPPGLWIEKGNFSVTLLNYVPDEGEGLYRRSLYTFIRRTSPPPSMLAFDGVDRTTCAVRRQRTNTPMQALVLMNDPQYVEAARLLAERMQLEGGAALHDQLTYGFRLVTARRPKAAELDLFSALYEEELQRFTADPRSADSLLQVGNWPRNRQLDRPRTAALAVLASLMINHDEAYTKR